MRETNQDFSSDSCAREFSLPFSFPIGSSLCLTQVMELEVESQIVCPYCGAMFTTVVDTSSGTFSTIEDCEVCCRPIAFNVHCHYGEVDSVDIDRA
jgi:hypothetical protein